MVPLRKQLMRATATAGAAARAGFAPEKAALARTAGARIEPIFTMLRRVRRDLSLKLSKSLVTVLPERFDIPQT
jgi:hypothetical protein